MAKKVTTNTVQAVKRRLQKTEGEAQLRMLSLIENAYTARRDTLERLLNPGKDVDYECGYPKDIDKVDYKRMFDREGLAHRVVCVMPEESWTVQPDIYETEGVEDTEFEKKLMELIDDNRLFHYLERMDILSGIGRFGILLFGLNDGKPLESPVEGIDQVTGEYKGKRKKEVKLLYLKPFDESVVTIAAFDENKQSPRYGYPTMYTLETADERKSSLRVHWTRVVHIADNRSSSEVYGEPRMKCVYNRLLDIRKILSGSGEMFWKGGYPGLSFQLDPNIAAANATIDTDSLKEEIEKYMSGLQRYLKLEGIVVKSLQPQVADPEGHIKAQLQQIAITLGIPSRVLMGSEEARLAASQDARTWNRRVAKRQENYLTLLLVRPVIDRLIAFGVLPEVPQYFVSWPDLNTIDEKDKSDIAKTVSEALGQYVRYDVESIYPLRQFYTNILGMSAAEAEEIIRARTADMAEEEGIEDSDATMPGVRLLPPAEEEPTE